MPHELFTAIILHPDLKPDSPLYSLFETTTSEKQIVSDRSSSVSDDQPSLVQPLNVGKPEAVIKPNNLNYTSFFNKQSNIILESISKQASVDNASDNMVLSDSDDEGIPVIYVDRNPDTPSASTLHINQDLPTPPTTKPINFSPPHTLLFQSTILG